MRDDEFGRCRSAVRPESADLAGRYDVIGMHHGAHPIRPVRRFAPAPTRVSGRMGGRWRTSGRVDRWVLDYVEVPAASG